MCVITLLSTGGGGVFNWSSKVKFVNNCGTLRNYCSKRFSDCTSNFHSIYVVSNSFFCFLSQFFHLPTWRASLDDIVDGGRRQWNDVTASRILFHIVSAVQLGWTFLSNMLVVGQRCIEFALFRPLPLRSCTPCAGEPKKSVYSLCKWIKRKWRNSARTKEFGIKKQKNIFKVHISNIKNAHIPKKAVRTVISEAFTLYSALFHTNCNASRHVHSHYDLWCPVCAPIHRRIRRNSHGVSGSNWMKYS